MNNEELQPTIKNPFGDEKTNSRRRTYASSKSAVLRPLKPSDSPTEETKPQLNFQTGFYVSLSSKRLIQKYVDEDKLTSGELPLIFELSMIAAKLFHRTSPSVSDVEIALKFRTIDHMKQVANDEAPFDLLRNDPTSGHVLPVKQLTQLWKMVATQMLEEYNKKHPTTA
jgi:hypothetical protein